MSKILFPDEVILKTKLFNLAQDWEVPIVGFFILAPNRKIKSISEFTDNESKEFMELLIKTRKGMRDILGIESVYLFQIEDSKYDFHLAFFPRHEWTEQFGKKVGSIKPIMNYAEENMTDEKTIKEVKEAVRKMKEYMADF